MWLFAGLGNPGDKYAGNRHNIGFMALDAIASSSRAPVWRSRFQALVSEATLGSERVLLIKPMTYMNASGQAIGEAARFYKIEPDHVVVFHDELDLPPASLRAKIGGGNAGHNGLRSTSAVIGNDYHRIRLGIGHPGDKGLVHAYVLSDFAKAERPWVEDICGAVADNAALLLDRNHAGFLGKIALAMSARGHVSNSNATTTKADEKNKADVKRVGENEKKD